MDLIWSITQENVMESVYTPEGTDVRTSSLGTLSSIAELL